MNSNVTNTAEDLHTDLIEHHDRILILDFGSQVTQLIARRVRESGTYCEIWPFNNADITAIKSYAPKGIILSGGPCSVTDEGSPRAPEGIFDMGLPIFGICYGQQTMVEQLGGKVEAGHDREFGRAYVDVKEHNSLLDGVWDAGAHEQVWMSHGDRVTALPEGFKVVGASEGAPYAMIADDDRKFYAVQFHPEVVHTPHGAALLKNFTHNVCGCNGDWTMAAFRAAVGEGRPVVVESPTYWGAMVAAAQAGVTLVPVASGPEGPEPDDVDRALASSGARAFYAQPTFANPHGAQWTDERARAVRELAGDDAIVIACDVERPEEIERLAEKLAGQSDRLHGLVHSIAFADYSAGWLPFHETPRAAFLQAVDISCFSLVAVSNALRELLDPDHGSVVTVSISTTRMTAENYGYMAPVKAALDSSVCFLAKSFSAFSRVRFNAVCPGLLKTSASAGIPGYVDSYLYAEEATLRKQAVQTVEVANTVAFLLSPRSAGINAQGLVVDAGMGVNYFDNNLVGGPEASADPEPSS